jgi:hypothetical protein
VLVAALILLIIAVLLVVAAVFGGGANTTLDLGTFNLEANVTTIFFLGMGTLLLLVLAVGLFRSGTKRASARRADRKKVSELSTKLDAYKREERESATETQHDER